MRNDVRTYIHIAHALARAYMDLFYVNMDTGEYIEFHTEEENVVNIILLSKDFCDITKKYFRQRQF